MYCGKCGFELEDGSLFCGNCGSPVQGARGPIPLDDDSAAAIESLDPTDDFEEPMPRAAAETVVLENPPAYGADQGQGHTEPLGHGGYGDPARQGHAGYAAAAAGGATAPTGKGRNTKIIAIASAIAAAAVAFALVWFFTHGGMELIDDGHDKGQSTVAETETAQSGPTETGKADNAPSNEIAPKEATGQADTYSNTKDDDASSSSTDATTEQNGTSVTKTEKQTESKNDSSTDGKTSPKKDDSSSSKSDANKDSQEKAPAAPAGGEYVLSDSDTRYYSESELKGMSPRDLYVARNEIYARHGRGFKNADLQGYFDSKSWYTKRYEPDDFDKMASPLNDYEQKNADLMLKVETDMNSPYLDKKNRPSI